jgi:signal transduction histidine kinase
VEVSSKDSFVEVSVTDSGSGIPKEIQDKIMQPFFTTKPLGQGTGLGLSISKGFAESNGGSLTLDVASPQTKFILRLPRAVDSKVVKMNEKRAMP